MSNTDAEQPSYMNACAETAKKIPGRLHIWLERSPIEFYPLRELVVPLDGLTYASHTVTPSQAVKNAT